MCFYPFFPGKAWEGGTAGEAAVPDGGKRLPARCAFAAQAGQAAACGLRSPPTSAAMRERWPWRSGTGCARLRESVSIPCGKLSGRDVRDSLTRECGCARHVPRLPVRKKGRGRGYGDGRRKCRLDRTDDTGHRQDVAAYCGPKKESSCRPRVPALPLPFHFSADDTPAGLPAGVPPCGGDMRVFFPSLRMLSALLTGFLPKALPCVLSDGRRTPQRFFPLQPPSCGHPA